GGTNPRATGAWNPTFRKPRKVEHPATRRLLYCGPGRHVRGQRKDLADLVHSLTAARAVFVSRLKKMSVYPHRLLVITATLSSIKSPYAFSHCNPNHVMQALIALLAGWGVPFVCTETHELGEETMASYLYQVHLYHWLEVNGQGRHLGDDD